jgi:hypothetical protein
MSLNQLLQNFGMPSLPYQEGRVFCHQTTPKMPRGCLFSLKQGPPVSNHRYANHIVECRYSKILLHFCGHCRIFCEGVKDNGNRVIKEHLSGIVMLAGLCLVCLVELIPAFGHNSVFGLVFCHNMASGPASGHNLTFGHNLAIGLASGHNLASGPASGHNSASGPAVGHNSLVELIMAIGHTNGLISHIALSASAALLAY